MPSLAPFPTGSPSALVGNHSSFFDTVFDLVVMACRGYKFVAENMASVFHSPTFPANMSIMLCRVHCHGLQKEVHFQYPFSCWPLHKS